MILWSFARESIHKDLKYIFYWLIVINNVYMDMKVPNREIPHYPNIVTHWIINDMKELISSVFLLSKKSIQHRRELLEILSIDIETLIDIQKRLQCISDHYYFGYNVDSVFLSTNQEIWNLLKRTKKCLSKKTMLWEVDFNELIYKILNIIEAFFDADSETKSIYNNILEFYRNDYSKKEYMTHIKSAKFNPKNYACIKNNINENWKEELFRIILLNDSLHDSYLDLPYISIVENILLEHPSNVDTTLSEKLAEGSKRLDTISNKFLALKENKQTINQKSYNFFKLYPISTLKNFLDNICYCLMLEYLFHSWIVQKDKNEKISMIIIDNIEYYLSFSTHSQDILQWYDVLLLSANPEKYSNIMIDFTLSDNLEKIWEKITKSESRQEFWNLKILALHNFIDSIPAFNGSIRDHILYWSDIDFHLIDSDILRKTILSQLNASYNFNSIITGQWSDPIVWS